MYSVEQTIQSLFDEATQYDEPYTAHLIYYATRKGKVKMQDSESKLFEMDLTIEEQEEIKTMREADLLNIRKVKLYVIKRSSTTYVFYFANNPWDARKLHHELYGRWENHITYAYNQMIDKSLYYPDSKETKTFRELLKESVVFPRWVCELDV